MTRALLVAFVFALGSLATLATAHAQAPEEPPSELALPYRDAEQLRAAAVALDSLRIEEASTLLDALVLAHPNDPDVVFEHGLLRYHQGDYARARTEMVGAVLRATGLRATESRLVLARIAYETHEATRSFTTTTSADGRYVVRHSSQDARMAGYAIDVLRRVDAGLTDELGYRHPGPIRLDILPTTQHLARVSSLTEAEIETTGTIALCKWDRLIITSPRAFRRGYAWADTIGHEFVHLVLARRTNENAPVWVQEGYARYLERRWHGADELGEMDPHSAELLREAVAHGTLLPFERLHPSIARLPTADLAALAYAQVSTFVGLFHDDHGAVSLRDVAAHIATGEDAREAFASVAGEPWAALERHWREHLETLPEPATRAEPDSLRFRHGGEGDDDTEEVAQRDARDALRLGDMLFARERALAAAHEYERAHTLAPDDPIVASRLGRASLLAGNAQRALEVTLPLREAHPEHAPLLALIADAAAQSGQLSLARDAALASIWQNPFDPEPHCALAASTDDPALAELAASTCAGR